MRLEKKETRKIILTEYKTLVKVLGKNSQIPNEIG